MLQAPCAGISLILNDAGILLATHGVQGWLAEAGGMPAEWAPCAQVVRQNAPLLIADTHDDPAHTANPLVTITGVRSYAGVPLHSDGQPVGPLCVLAGRVHRRADAHHRNAAARRRLAQRPAARPCGPDRPAHRSGRRATLSRVPSAGRPDAGSDPRRTDCDARRFFVT
ncbi:GAF domain-containing protein [Paractinoplanes atraurantiacus]|uniref:GAF domain-containing protein n=1 Tax=Paractinoplanes atraurantiacus TaxID=1036182 RepID=A0A285JCH1_9ACTN|nr:GAF domain-containing protein [Actinoplanes atraurantiacus]SNY57086.1 GAF domain-containing protein [Actinoplanes atraurantiacus]